MQKINNNFFYSVIFTVLFFIFSILIFDETIWESLLFSVFAGLIFLCISIAIEKFKRN